MRRMHSAWVLSIALVAWGAALPEARANGNSSVAVIELYLGGGLSPAAGAWTQALERELRETRNVVVVDRSMALARLAAKGIIPARELSDERLDKVDKQVRDGEELLYTDPKAAVELLSRSLQELEAGLEAMATQARTRELVLRTRMLLARAYMDAGNEDAAAGVLRQVVAVFGDELSVTTRDYHPLMVQAYERTVRDMAPTKMGSLEIDGNFSKCKAWIDGHQMPNALPATFTGLYAGDRFVQVRCGDRMGLLRRIAVGNTGTQTARIDIDFEQVVVFDGEHLGLAFKDAGEAARLSTNYAARLGALMDVSYVAVHWREAGDGGGDAVLSTVDVASGAEVGRTRVAVKSGAVSPEAARLLAQNVLRGGSTRAEAGRSWKQNTGAWVLSGIGAAALIVGAVEGGLYFKYKGDATKAYDMTVQTREALEPQYKTRKDSASKANTAAIVGPVMLGVGAAALVGGIVWFVVDNGKGPKVAQHRFSVAPYWAAGGGGLTAFVAF